VDLTGLVNMTSDCAKYMMCGMPLYDHRWVEAMDDTMWLPRENPVWTPAEPILELRNKTVLADGKTIRFQFNLNCTDHTSIFINPNEDVTVSSWSFLEEYLTSNSPPYHIYYSYGIDNTPLDFSIDITVWDTNIIVKVRNLFQFISSETRCRLQRPTFRNGNFSTLHARWWRWGSRRVRQNFPRFRRYHSVASYL